MKKIISGATFFRNLFISLVLLTNISCDQISKMIVRERISYSEEIILIADRVTLTKVENTGAFLSLGSELPHLARTLILSFIPILAITLGLFYIFREPELSRVIQVGYAFVIGGGIGNLVDRVWRGSVTDFIHIDFGLFETGIFNMADVSIMIGVGLLIIGSLSRKLSTRNSEMQEK